MAQNTVHGTLWAWPYVGMSMGMSRLCSATFSRFKISQYEILTFNRQLHFLQDFSDTKLIVALCCNTPCDVMLQRLQH